MANKKRIATSVAAVATAAALLLGGTFAWQSVNQTALNEASDVINPGGRLHDDFSYTEEIKNKDVYVENFADEEIFARVRIEEYFEITMNKGTPAENNEILIGGEEIDGEGNPVYDENGEAVKTYTTFTNYDSLVNGTLQAAVDGDGTAWWSWETGGETIYMPTFNLNKDSLQADINGTYAGPDGTDGENEGDDADRYGDYYEYHDGEEKTADAIYDADGNSIEDDGTTAVSEIHYAKATGNGELISMADWDGTAGPYWVYDADGWVYWAQPIQPDTATGLLLDNIALNQVMDDSWYYAINVVAQFVTADDLGKTDGTGFYDSEKGTAPSADALALLEAIGVKTDGPVMVDTAEELQEALANGENVIIDGEIEATEATEDETGLSFDYNILWHEGGTVNGGELTLGNAYQGLFINNENNWPVPGDGANPATMNDTSIYASKTNAAVYAQAIDAPVELNNVTIDAGSVGVWAEYGDDTVTLNNCEITSRGGNTEAWLDSAVAASYGGHVIINGGTYTGDNAVYVYSSGGTIEINGGTFSGELHEDAGELIIKGGTFDHDPTAFVDAENYDVTDNGNGTWTVSEKARGLYVLYLEDDEGSSYATNPLLGTDGFVSMVYQEADTTIAVDAMYYGNADLSLPEGVTISLAAYGLAVDEWEEISNVSAGTVYTAGANPYTFDTVSGILSDGSGDAVATIDNTTSTITINKVVENLIVDVYLLKDGERIPSTGSSSDVEKLFNSKYFVVSAAAGESDTTPPTISVEELDYFNQLFTVADVTDNDFPLTVKMYYLDSDEADYVVETPMKTITITKTGDSIAYSEESDPNDMGQLKNVTMTDGKVQLDYNLAPPERYCLHAVVSDVSGNEASENIWVSRAAGCFVAGTQVQTVKGLVNIEDIKVGEQVYSLDLSTDEQVVSTVSWVQGTRYIDATYTIYAGGEKVVTTYEHPFYVMGKEWVAAEDLTVGDVIKTVDGEVTITNIVYTELDAPVQVYNFTVEGTHNYLVSESGLLVHNIVEK